MGPVHLCFLYLLILTFYTRLFTLRNKWLFSINCGYMNLKRVWGILFLTSAVFFVPLLFG